MGARPRIATNITSLRRAVFNRPRACGFEVPPDESRWLALSAPDGVSCRLHVLREFTARRV